MVWDVEYTNEFGEWYGSLTEPEQDAIDRVVVVLEGAGVRLGMPYSSAILSSRHGHMRELRIQHRGRAIRVLYAFNELRTAILLVGGDKTGNNRWYEEFVPIADNLYDEHLKELEEERKEKT
jgi:hypothetical protein